MRTIASISTLVFLSACSSGVYRPVNANKVSSIVPAPATEQPAKITVKRYKVFWGGGLDGRFTINRKEIVKLSRGEMYSFTIDPGKYEFGVKSYQPMALIPIPMYFKYDLKVESGKEYVFYLYATGGMGVAIDLVTNQADWD